MTINAPGDCAGNEVTGTTVGAASDHTLTGCDGVAYPKVFYSINTGDYSQIVLHLNPDIPGTNLFITVFSDCDSNQNFYCDVIIGNGSLTISNVNPNTTYIIKVSMYPAYSGAFTICVEGAYDCPSLEANFGEPCDDGDPNTIDDIVTQDCNCEGVPVSNGSISGTIAGWNSGCAERSMKVSLMNFITGTFYTDLPGTLHSNGSFTLNGSPAIIPGTYSVLVKVDGALAIRLDDVVISAGMNTSISVPPVILGDMNNDNVINISDISQFTAAFGSAFGDSNYNPLADFNCDGIINISDVYTISSGYGQGGDALTLP